MRSFGSIMNDADYSFVNQLNFLGFLVITLVSRNSGRIDLCTDTIFWKF